MADNITLPGSGSVAATDDVSGVHFQKVKLDLGGDGATAPVSGSVPTSGDVAHDAADSGNPVKMGGKAYTGTPGAVSADGDRVNAWFNTRGAQATFYADANGNVPSLVDGSEDAVSTSVFGQTTRDFLLGYNGTNWDRVRVANTGRLQVDVVTGGGGGTQYTEGDTDASITGSAMLWEDGSDTLRAVSAAKPLPVDLQDSSVTVANAGTFATQVDGAALTALELIDDTVYTDDTSTHATGTSKGNLMMAAAAPTDAAVNANDIGAVAMTTDRKLHVSVQDAIPAGTNNIGDVDVLSVPADPFGANADAASATGSISAKLRFIAATGIPVTSVPSHAVTNAGTFATQVDGAALTALQLIDDTVFADEASFTVASSKVNTVGLHAVASGSAPDSTAADTAVNPITNRNRVPFVIGGDPGVITLKHTNITTAVTDAAIITISTGNKIVVTRLTVTLDNASTVFPTCVIGFGTANTPTTTGVLFAHGGVPAGGGATIGDGSGILGVGADNEDLRVTTTGNATGNGLQITVSYYLIVA